jgi:hypothetical protein
VLGGTVGAVLGGAVGAVLGGTIGAVLGGTGSPVTGSPVPVSALKSCTPPFAFTASTGDTATTAATANTPILLRTSLLTISLLPPCFIYIFGESIPGYICLLSNFSSVYLTE